MTRERAQLSPFDYYLEMIAEARRRWLQRRRGPTRRRCERERVAGAQERASVRLHPQLHGCRHRAAARHRPEPVHRNRQPLPVCVHAHVHTQALARSLARHSRARCRSKGWLKKLRSRGTHGLLTGHSRGTHGALQVEGMAQEAARSVDIRRAAVAPRRRAHRVLVEGAACARVARGIQEVRPTGHRCHICARTGRRRHICARTATSGPGLGSPLRRLHQDLAGAERCSRR